MSKSLRKMRLKIESAGPAMLVVLENSNKTLFDKAVKQLAKWSNRAGTAKQRKDDYSRAKYVALKGLT